MFHFSNIVPTTDSTISRGLDRTRRVQRVRQTIGVSRNRRRGERPINGQGPFVSSTSADSCFPKSIDVRHEREIEFLRRTTRSRRFYPARRVATFPRAEVGEKVAEEVAEHAGDWDTGRCSMERGMVEWRHTHTISSERCTVISALKISRCIRSYSIRCLRANCSFLRVLYSFMGGDDSGVSSLSLNVL